MKPYFQDELVTLYHADCLENPDLWTGADVLVTDPPYGISYSRHVRATDPQYGIRIAGDDTLDARDSVLGEWGDRPAIVFGTWRVPKPLQTRQTGIWSKGDTPGMGDLNMPWGNSFEEFYVLGSGFIGPRESAVITAKKPDGNNRPDHPTPKPVGLMERLIEHCPPEWVIADPFTGSGATLLAARNLGRKAIGVEIEERYCEITARRLSQQVFDFQI